MELYFHHVGQRGSDEDFPKTVFGRVALSQIEGAIGPDDPLRAVIVGALRERFPEGWCNAWGVPVGARSSIASLNTGDAVLLVESVAGRGSVPAVCPDVLYWNRAYHTLSEELWGNSKYPFVFYFRTEPLDLTWQEMRANLDYAADWIPRNFFRITPNRLVQFGGPEGYLQRVLRRHSRGGSALARVSEGELTQPGAAEDLVADEINRQQYATHVNPASEPGLTEALEPPGIPSPEPGSTGSARVPANTGITDKPLVAVPPADPPPPQIQTREVRAHTEIQWLLLTLGSGMGLDVWVARNDRGGSFDGHRFADLPRLLNRLPRQFDDVTHRTIELIDVLWLRGTAIVAAFEIESTTAIYSGLLRMADLLAMQPNVDIPLYLVAPDERRRQVAEQVNRPTFARALRKPLPDVCRFVPFSALRLHASTNAALLPYLNEGFLANLSESCRNLHD